MAATLVSNEVKELIAENIAAYCSHSVSYDQGCVLQVGDGIVRVSGLPNLMLGETLLFGESDEEVALGVVMNLEKKSCTVMLLDKWYGAKIRAGDPVRTNGCLLSYPVGHDSLGRVFDSGMVTMDGSPIEYRVPSPLRPMEAAAPGIIDRRSVFEPLHTGIIAIDSMIPIGRGQRELIIGDRQTGKTSVAIDAILNQKDERVICVYVAIGQRASSVAALWATLGEAGAHRYTVLLAANAHEPASRLYLAPYAGTAIAEYFMYEGEQTLVVYDDLTKHAYAYRQLSLLLRRPPGREAYPGDVFYLHSRLLERSAKLKQELGNGSMTAFPIIETQAGDVSAYIPTNVISITDGQIFLSGDLFNAGFRPAINVGISVSRVGSAAQSKAMKQVAGKLKLELAQFTELEAFSQFASDIDSETKKLIDRGKRLREILKQPQNAPYPIDEQVGLIFAANDGYFDKIPLEDIKKSSESLIDRLKTNAPEEMKLLRRGMALTEEIITVFKGILWTGECSNGSN